MLGEIEGTGRRGQQRMRWLHGVTHSIDMSLSELREMVKDSLAGCSPWGRRVGHDRVTEQQSAMGGLGISVPGATQPVSLLMDCSHVASPHLWFVWDGTEGAQEQAMLPNLHPSLTFLLPDVNHLQNNAGKSLDQRSDLQAKKWLCVTLGGVWISETDLNLEL